MQFVIHLCLLGVTGPPGVSWRYGGFREQERTVPGQEWGLSFLPLTLQRGRMGLQ